MKTQNTPTGAENTTVARSFRASIDETVVGYFSSMSAAMKALSSRAIKEEGGYNGYVDVYDPEDKILPGKEAQPDGYKLLRHRVVDGGAGNNGWFWND
jgi:hypothetical protein